MVNRRDFLKGTGSVAAIGATGYSSMSTQSEEDEPEDLYRMLFEMSGKLVVGEFGFDTIQEAWDAAESGDEVFVHSTYNAKEAGESFPIVLDYSEKEVTVTGAHPSGSVIDARYTEENVVEVIGEGHHDYRNSPLVQNLKIIGGNVGLRVRGAPYSSYKDIICWMCGSHGIQVEEYVESDGTKLGNFSTTWRNVVAWNCGGSGFRLESSANPHDTTFLGCYSVLNDGYGVMLRGYNSTWDGGTVQNNGLQGFDVRSGGAQVIENTYLEGNSTSSDGVLSIYVDESSNGLSIENCYFNGFYARDFETDDEIVPWGIVAYGADNLQVKNTTFRNYENSFILLRETVDADVYRHSHHSMDSTEFIQEDDTTRTRYNGVIKPTNLSNISGKYTGDIAFDNSLSLHVWDEQDNKWKLV